jgi:hypothetical protein
VVCAVDNVCAIELPELALEPVIFGAVTVHAYVVLGTPFGVVNANAVVVPVQNDTDAGVERTLGTGFTVTTTASGVPEQLLAVGVIVYVAVCLVVCVVDKVCGLELPDDALAPVMLVADTVQL